MKPEELLHHSDFVSRLARSLVRDEHLAADLSQETLAAALAHPPEAGQALRPWLSRVARNFWSKQLRGEKRRWRREGEAAVPDIVPPTEEIVEREEIRRKVVEAVLGLKEPYRSTILLRFYEDMPPRMIAKHFEVPVETVRTRVKKGLDLLRGHLDIDHGGDRKRWCLALAPLAGLKLKASSALIPGVIVMSMKWKIACIVALLLSVSFGLWHVFSGNPENKHTEDLRAETKSGVAYEDTKPLEGSEAPKPAARRNPGAQSISPDIPKRILVEPGIVRLSGIVKNPEGARVPEAEIFLEKPGHAPRKVAESDSDGTFEADRIAPGAGYVFAETKDGLRSVRKKVELAAGESVHLELNVGYWLEISGRVTASPGGKPIEGARIKAMGVGDLEDHETVSREDGSYLLEGLKRTTFLIEVSSKSFGTRLREGVPSGSKNVDFALSRPGVLKGVVKEASTGAPVKRFRIELVPAEYHLVGHAAMGLSMEAMIRRSYYKQHRDFHQISAFESEDGSFEIPCIACGRYYLACGAESRELKVLPLPLSIEAEKETFQEIILSPAPILRGRVLDVEEELPVQGARVKAMASGPSAGGFHLSDERDVTTDWGGCFEFPFAVNGLNLLEIAHKDFSSRRIAVHLKKGKPLLGKGAQEGVSLEGEALIIRLDMGRKAGRIAVSLGGDILDLSESLPLIAVMGFGDSEIGVPDESGSFLSRPLEAGPYNVLLIEDGGIAGNKPAEVKPDETTNVRFGEEAGGARVSGAVYSGMDLYEGEGFATLVIPKKEGNQPLSTVQLKGGRFLMTGLEKGAGVLNVVLMSDKGYGFSFSKTITWGDEEDVKADLILPGGSLEVRAWNQNTGAPVFGAKVEAFRKPARGTTGGWEFKGSAAAKSGEEGTAILRHLPRGAYSLRVTSEGFKPFEEDLEITQGGKLIINAVMTRPR